MRRRKDFLRSENISEMYSLVRYFKNIFNEEVSRYFLIFLLAFVPQLIIIFTESPILLWEENIHLATAKKFIEADNYSEGFQFSILEWILASLIVIFGDNITIIKIVLILIYSISVIFLFKIFEEYYKDSWKNSLFTFFYVVNGINLFWASRICSDVLGASFLILSLYFYYRYYYKREDKDLVCSTFFGVLSFLAKLYYGLWLVILLMTLENRVKVRFLMYLLIFVFPWLLYNIIYYESPLRVLINQYNITFSWQHSESILRFINNLLVYIGFITVSLLLYTKINAVERPIYFYTLILLVYFTVFVEFNNPRHFIAILPTLIILARATVDRIPGTLLILLLAYTFSAGQSALKGINDIIQYRFCWDGTDIISFAINYLRNHNASVVLSNCCWIWIRNTLGIESYALWSENVSYLIQLYKPDYIVYSPNYGILLNYSFKNLEEVVEYEDVCGLKVIIYSRKPLSPQNYLENKQ